MSESTPTGSTTSARGSSSKAAARGGSRRHAGVDVVDEEHRIHEGTGFAAWLFVPVSYTHLTLPTNREV